MGKRSSSRVSYRGVAESTQVGISPSGEGVIDEMTERRLTSAREAGLNGGKVCPDCKGTLINRENDPCETCEGKGWVPR